LPSSVPFAEWADRERMRLAGRAALACAELVERATGSGDWMEAIRRAEQWLTLEPCSEAAAARLLALRAQTGDVGGAIAFYEGFRSRLHTELTLAPGAELVALAEGIRRSAPSPPPALVPRGVPTSPVSALPLVGRESEFARLRVRWESAAAGRRQLVLLTGEPGIGKTRLAREFASYVKLQGATILYGRAYEVEQGVPYAALTGVLRAALDAPGLAGVDAASLGELSRIVPEIATRFRSGVAPPANDFETGRVRLLEAAGLLFENLAFEAPVLLLLDDLPWADEATLTALHYLWRRLPDTPLLLLATARAADISANAALERVLSAASREAPEAIERIPLAPLGTEAIARLAAEAGISANCTREGEPLAAVLARESGGNPLFLSEALRARLEGSESPASRESVRLAVAELTGDLSPPARQLLQAAAALGRHFPLPLAAAVAGLPHPEAIGALEELLAQRLLQRVDYEYDFVHDLLRQSVYGELSPERCRMLHRSAYERLAPREGEEVGLERASGLAMHAVQGELAPAAHYWLLHAAERAKAVFAGAEAERFLAQAVEFAATAAEHRTVWEHIGDLRRAQSRFGAAALAFHHALGHTEPGSAVRLGLRIKLLDASLRSGVLRLPDAAAAISTLVEDAGEAGSAFLRDALRVAASAYLLAGDLGRAEEHALRAVEAARSAEEP
ncbi:MAG TPA: AAA family ATPase, partial [Longimicrobiaceae bacterium]|nr:AAA family ATPase [Longimicrobiaceae bacterium]